MIPQGSWVQIHRVILQPEERSQNLPKETRETPLKMWTKGFLRKAANLGDTVEITTLTGRSECGVLIDSAPAYRHDFGKFIPELITIDHMVKSVLDGDDSDE
jgi:hypothetical protein